MAQDVLFASLYVGLIQNSGTPNDHIGFPTIMKTHLKKKLYISRGSYPMVPWGTTILDEHHVFVIEIGVVTDCVLLLLVLAFLCYFVLPAENPVFLLFMRLDAFGVSFDIAYYLFCSVRDLLLLSPLVLVFDVVLSFLLCSILSFLLCSILSFLLCSTIVFHIAFVA